MSDLIARLEAATEGSRELDAEIGRAVIGFDPRMLPTHIPDIGEIPSPWPRYTTSVDAAMTLVPHGWIWRHAPSQYVPHSVSVAPDYSFGGHIGEHDHSAALAIVIAVLRARSAP